MLRSAILIGALASGGAAAWVSTAMTAAPPAARPEVLAATVPQSAATTQVLVAAGPLAPGAILAPENLLWQDWPEDAVSEGFILRSAQPDAQTFFAGQITGSDLAVGEPIRVERLVRGDGGFLSVTLAPGKRAVAVRVSAQSSAGGFIMPGDRVDVVRTFSMTNSAGVSQMVSETILQNVGVLAIDQSTLNRGEGALLGETATLELDAAQVETVVASEAMGMLSLSLRSFADYDDVPRVAEAATQASTVRIFRSGIVEEVVLP